MSNSNNGSKIEYECGCTMQRASFHDLWEREYICGVHKATITSPPESVADKVWKLADPAYTPNRPEDASAAPEHLRANRLQPVVNPFESNERSVLLTLCAIRQYEVLKERRDIERYYIEGDVKELRLKALRDESDALASAMKKLYVDAT